MILYYAPGGGLGHLTRGRRVLETLGLASDAAFLTASPYATDVRVTGNLPVVSMPATLEGDLEAHRAWMRDAVAGADRLIIDTFPAGIQGELEDFGVPMDLVARSLRWDVYRREVPSPLPRFDRIWSIEPLRHEHETALRAQATSWSALDLRTPPSDECPRQAPYWLIVHSGPPHEVEELVAHAEELRRIEGSSEPVLVATRSTIALPPAFERIDAVPVTHLLAGATRIVSAAGYNIMLETEPHRAKHHPIPFARRYDDQYARATRRRLHRERSD
ncbi:MAG: hypothetical protein ABI779_06100 [Acidobacteriota bacterium]